MPSRQRVVLERLEPWFLARVLAMMREIGADYERDPATGFYRQSALASAWRSNAHQWDLWLTPHQYPVAYPGTSRHEKARAVDWMWWAIGAVHAIAAKAGMGWPGQTSTRS